jgi:lycopene beta-cyclase
MPKSFDEFIYERIPGDKFYQSMHEKIFKDSRFSLLVEPVRQVSEDKASVTVETNSGRKVQALQVWNSLSQGKSDMIQHFFGFEIETEKDFFNESVVDLMDFRVDQNNEVRFVYHLPFSKRLGLVEFTIFSNKVLAREVYDKELRDYLLKIFNLLDYKVLRVEMGSIPMTIDPWPRFSSPMGMGRISSIGGASGKIKASTGYSFMRNQTGQPARSFDWRFRVYDTLLIGIMRSKGQEIAKIFPQLFAQNSSHTLFCFLDEKTKFHQELGIFLKLPWKNFLIQLVLSYPFYFVASLLVAINAFTYFKGPSHSLNWMMLAIPTLGILLFGISHGAIDHKLNPQVSKLKFYFFYLAGLCGFFALWFVSPVLALAVFILMSSDHFGESQFLRALKISGNQLRIRILSGIWGLAVSLMPAFFHWETAKPILQTLLMEPGFGEFLRPSKASYVGYFLGLMAIATAKIISRYEVKALGRNVPGALSTVILVLIFWALPLIPGFLTFFCFWHSWDTILQQRKTLNWSAKEYLRAAAPFTTLASLSLMVLALAFDKLGSIESYLFLFLGALTVSHSVVMKRFYQF